MLVHQRVIGINSVYQGAWFQKHCLLESTPLCQVGWSNTQFAALIDVKFDVAHPQAKISAMTSASFTGPYHLTIKIFKLCRSLIQIMIIMIMMSSKMIMIAI